MSMEALVKPTQIPSSFWSLGQVLTSPLPLPCQWSLHRHKTDLKSKSYPLIGLWLNYLDSHPIRGKHQINFARYAAAFQGEGFFAVNQLVLDRVTIEKLSNWLGIWKGIADFLIDYTRSESIKLGTLSAQLGGTEDWRLCICWVQNDLAGWFAYYVIDSFWVLLSSPWLWFTLSRTKKW